MNNVIYVNFKTKKIERLKQINNLNTKSNEHSELYNKLILEGYEFAGNIDEYNQELLDKMTSYLRKKEVEYQLELAYDKEGNLIPRSISFWINVNSFNNSSIIKKFVFFKSPVKTGLDAFMVLLKKLKLEVDSTGLLFQLYKELL